MKLGVAALLLVGLPLQAQQACDTRAYALSAPDSRFEDHADGTVTDRRSKLMWMRCSAGQSWSGGACSGELAGRDWDSAQVLADDINRRGEFFYDDWRLPNLAELATITERQCSNPRVNLAVFPATAADLYWTVTLQMGSGETARVFALSFGAAGFEARPKAESHFVRLVRSDVQ